MKKPKKNGEASSNREETCPPANLCKSNTDSDSDESQYAKCTKKLPTKRKAKKSSKKHDKRRHRKERSPSSSSSQSDSSTSTSSSSSSDSLSPSDDSENSSKRLKKSGKTSDSGRSSPDENNEHRSRHKPTLGSSDVSGNKQSKIGQNSRRDYSDIHNNRSKWDSPNQEVDRIKRERSRRHDREDDCSRSENRRRSNERRPCKTESSFTERYTRQRNDYRDRSDRVHSRGFNDGRDRGYRKEDYNDRTRLNNGYDRQNRSPRRRRDYPRRSDDDGKYEWGKRGENDKVVQVTVEKEKPNFGLSGKLAEDTNKVNGILIKYSEPPESRKPKRRWRLYPFKGEKVLPTMYIHRQSCYLVGRDRNICDLPVDHPSCSKQHAALQYRLVPFERPDGTAGKRVRPYIIDLESANGTFLNNKKIESKKYIELLEKDVIKFGFSTREYVMLHENSKEDQMDDDIKEEIQIKKEKVE